MNCLLLKKTVLPIFLCLLIMLVPACHNKKASLESAVKIPHSKDSRTRRDVQKEEYEWMLRSVAPIQLGLETKQTAFLQDICRYYTNQPSPELEVLESRGKELVTGPGGNEPLVLLWYGNILYENKKFDPAEYYISKGLEMTEKKQRPRTNSFFAMKNIAMIHYNRTNSARHTDFIESLALDFLFQAIKNGEFKSTEMPIAINQLKRIDMFPFEKIWQSFNHRIQEEKDVDPWLRYVVYGHSEIDEAWSFRGRGWAKDVTDKGWKKFESHLHNAGNALTKAWNLHPEYPQAATGMITVAMGGYKNASEELWFSRSVAAQMDYSEAYHNYLNASLPRWGGSYEKMLQFGEACLATQRFDTDVPMFYLVTARKAAVDLKNNRWRAVFHEKRVKRNLDKLFNGLLKEESRRKDRDRILTQQALTEMWRGNYSNAQTIFEKVDSDVRLSDGFCGKALSWSGRGRRTINAELRGFTGPYKELLKKAEHLSISNSEESIPLFIEGMKKYSDDKTIQSYLRRRIALQMTGCRASRAFIGRSALHIAAFEGSADAVKFLVENGADINAKDDGGDTPFHYAAANGKVDLCDLLLKNEANIDATNKKDQSPLYIACLRKQKKTASFLVKMGADINLSGNLGNSPLHIAILYHLPETASLLIKNDADLQKLSNNNWSPLHCAIFYNEPQIALQLIEKGADVNVRNGSNFTPLMIAVYARQPSVIENLIEKKANIEARTPEGWTALHLAAEYDRPEILKLLINHKANVKAKNSTEMTPYDRAEQFGNERCMEILKKALASSK